MKRETYRGDLGWPDGLQKINKTKRSLVYKGGYAIIVTEDRKINQRNLKQHVEKIDLFECIGLRMQINFNKMGNID